MNCIAISHAHNLPIGLLSLFLYAGQLRADDVLLTKAGTPLRIILRDHSAIHLQPDKTSTSEPVSQFQFFYELPAKRGTKEKLRNGFYKIATAPKEVAAVGWIPQDAVVERSHAQVAGFRPHSGRDLVLFFKSKEDAEK